MISLREKEQNSSDCLYSVEHCISPGQSSEAKNRWKFGCVDRQERKDINVIFHRLYNYISIRIPKIIHS